MKSIGICFCLALFFLAGIIHHTMAQTPEQLYQQGLGKEEGEGALKDAINLFNQVADNSKADKSLQAKALLHVGLCYEKLGLKEATKAYQRLVNNFPGQKNEVAIARERLSKLEQVIAEIKRVPKFRKIEIASKPQNGVLSPDGRKLVFTSENSVWMVPLQGNVGNDIAGEPSRIAEVQGASNFFNVMAWSADGQWIAVNSGYNKEDFVYMIPIKGGEQRKVQLPNRDVGNFPFRLSLSPDGEKLAFSSMESGVITQNANLAELHIYVISSIGGVPKQISPGPGTLPSFSPNGKLIAYVTYHEKKELPKNVRETRYDSELWVINSSGDSPVKLAVADGRLGGPTWSPDGRFLAVTGRTDVGGKEIWIYPLSPDASNVGKPTVIALPGYSMGMLAGWTPDNELGVFIRSEYHSAVYTVPSSGGKAVQVTPEGVVYYPRWSPDGKRIFLRWVKQDETPPVQIVYVPAAGGNVTKIPWPKSALMSRVPGGGHNISPDGHKLIVSASEEPYSPQNYMDLQVIPLDDGLPVRLTNDKAPEKYPCWSPDGKWITFVGWQKTTADKGFDAIYRIPAEGGNPVQVTSIEDSVSFGAISFTPNGKQITFFSQGMIKTIPVEGGKSEVLVGEAQSDRWSQLAWSHDGSKIAFNVDGKIWITTLATGEKTELKTGLPENFSISEFDWSPDGQKITFMTTSGDEPEFWLISNFLPLDKLSQNKKINAAGTEGIKIKQISDGSNNTSSISADGEYIALADWDTGNLEIRNLKTGEKKLATNDATWNEPMQYIEYTLISPDGKLVAYQWYNSEGVIELRLTKVDTQIPSILYTCDKDEYVIPRLWFPDCKKLIAQRFNSKTKTIQLFSIDITNRDTQVLKENSGKYYKVNISLSPDQKQIAFDFPNASDQGLFDISLLSLDSKQELQLIKHPANDRLIGWLPGRNELLFTSDRSGTTDIWSVRTHGKEQFEVPRRIMTNIGDLDPVGFTENGSLYCLLSKTNYESFIIPCEGNGTKVSMNSRTPLPGQVYDVSWLPDGKSILCYGFIPEKFKRRGLHNLFVVNSATGEARALATNLTTSGQLRISPDCKSVLVFGFDQQRSNEKDYRGGIYIVNIETGTPFEIKIKQDIAPYSGTVEWDKEGKNIFYAGNNQVIKHNIESNEEKIIYNERQFTFPNIVRSVDGNNLIIDIMVDKTGADCQLFSIKENGGEAKLLCTHKDVSNIRFKRIALSPDGKYIYFSSLPDDWKTGLKSILYRIPSTGGTPENLWQSKEFFIAGMSIHPEGNKMALSTLELGSDMRVIENLGEEVTKIYSEDK